MAVRVITLGLLIGLSLTAFGDTLTGKVGRVVDGDTLYVLDANYAGLDSVVRLFSFSFLSAFHLLSVSARCPCPFRTDPIMLSWTFRFPLVLTSAPQTQKP